MRGVNLPVALWCIARVQLGTLHMQFDIPDSELPAFYAREEEFIVKEAEFHEMDGSRGGTGLLCCRGTDEAYRKRYNNNHHLCNTLPCSYFNPHGFLLHLRQRVAQHSHASSLLLSMLACALDGTTPIDSLHTHGLSSHPWTLFTPRSPQSRR